MVTVGSVIGGVIWAFYSHNSLLEAVGKTGIGIGCGLFLSVAYSFGSSPGLVHAEQEERLRVLQAEKAANEKTLETKLRDAEAKLEEVTGRPRLTLRCSPDTRTIGNLIVWLKNSSTVDAVNVRISDLRLPFSSERTVNDARVKDAFAPNLDLGEPDTAYTVKFNPIQSLVGDEVILTYDVEGMGNLERRIGLLSAVTRSRWDGDSLRCPITVTFSNLEGRTWTAFYEFTYNRFNGAASMDYKRVETSIGADENMTARALRS